MKKNQLPPSEADALRLRAEKRLQEQLARPGQPPPTAAETLRLIHELQVHQIELELQNHALLEMRAQLEQRAEKYADLYDFAPLSYFTLTVNGTIQEINLAGAALFGQDRLQLIGRRFGLFVSATTLITFNAFLAETLVGTSKTTCEIILAPEGLPSRFMRLEGIGTVSGGDQQCRIAAIDITERKQAETVLQSELFVKDVLDSLTAHIAVLDDQGNIILVNAAWQRFAEQNGGNSHCLVGANYLQVCRHALIDNGNAEARAALSGIRTVLSGVRPGFNLEYPCHSPAEPRWFVMRVFPLSGSQQGVVIAHEEITEQRRAEEERRASESRFRTLIELLPYGVQENDLTGRVTFANPVLERLHGQWEGGVVGRFIWDFLADDAERQPLRDYLQCLIREQPPPTPYFSKDRHINGSVIDCRIDWTYLYDARNQLQGFLSVITDITDRKRIDEALQESEARFRLLLEHTPAIAAQGYGSDGTVHYWNAAAEAIYGYTAQEAIGQNLLDLIIPPEMRSEAGAAIAQMALTGQALPMAELSLMHKNGSRVAVLSSHAVIQIPNKGVELFCLDMDISERKQMEEDLREREAQLQSIFRVAPVGIGLIFDRVIGEVNNVFSQITGYSREEAIGKNARFLYPTDQDYDYVGQEKYRQIAKTGTGTVETLWRRKDGKIINVLLSSTPLDSGDLAKGVTFTALDITQRKMMEEKLSASNEYSRAVLDSLNDAIFVDDANTGRIIDVNHSMCEMYGYSREEALQVDASQLSLGEEPYSQRAALEWLRKARAEGPQIFEWIAKTRAGHLFWVEVTIRFVIISGENRFIVTARDINQRKQTEQILRQYKYMVSAMSDAVSLLDQNYIYRVVNNEYLRRTGKTYDAIVGHSVADIMGEQVFQHFLKEKLDRCLTGEIIHFQQWFDIAKDRRFLDVIYSPYYDNQGVCSGIMVSSRDNTAVKRIEQALQASEEKYRQLFNSMINGFALHEMIYDEQGQACDYRFLEINPAFEQFTGMYATDLIGRTARQAFPYMEDHWIETYGQVTLTGEPVHFESHNLVLNKYFEIIAYRPKTGQFACLFTDITERKHIEEALNITLTKYKTLFDSFPLGVTVSDSAGRILETNLMAERLLGISRAEHNQRNIHGPEWRIVRPDGSLMPPEEYAGVRALTENHLVENMEMGVVTAQGNTTWLSVTAAPLPLEGYGVVITYSDITKSKQIEKDLRNSLLEKETLLREVHHRVKNNLAAIIGILDLQQNILADAPTISLLTELGGRIKSMALIHDMLYQSDHLSRIDFHSYLQSLISYLRGSFDPRGAVRFNVAATGIWMNIDTAIPCGLIINELVINALKYAFPVERCNVKSHPDEIAITVVWEDTSYTLTVADNGVGLPENLDWQTTRTLGLRLVRMLGQHQLQGTLTLDRTAGARFTLRFSSHSPQDRSADHDRGNHPDSRR